MKFEYIFTGLFEFLFVISIFSVSWSLTGVWFFIFWYPTLLIELFTVIYLFSFLLLSTCSIISVSSTFYNPFCFSLLALTLFSNLSNSSFFAILSLSSACLWFSPEFYLLSSITSVSLLEIFSFKIFCLSLIISKCLLIPPQFLHTYSWLLFANFFLSFSV